MTTLETKEKSSTAASILHSFSTALSSLASSCTTGTGMEQESVCQATMPYSFIPPYLDFQGK